MAHSPPNELEPVGRSPDGACFRFAIVRAVASNASFHHPGPFQPRGGTSDPPSVTNLAYIPNRLIIRTLWVRLYERGRNASRRQRSAEPSECLAGCRPALLAGNRRANLGLFPRPWVRCSPAIPRAMSPARSPAGAWKTTCWKNSIAGNWPSGGPSSFNTESPRKKRRSSACPAAGTYTWWSSPLTRRTHTVATSAT